MNAILRRYLRLVARVVGLFANIRWLMTCTAVRTRA